MTHTAAPANRRERLPVPPASVIRALPAVGKLMITAKRSGATHERIGTIEAVTIDDGWLVCSGTEHDSRIDPSAIVNIIVDRSSIMGDQAYPRIDFFDASEECLFSVVGFGGMAPFDAALAQFGPGEALPDKPRDPLGSKAEVNLEDPGARPFNLALDTGATVTVTFSRTGFSQRWSGLVERVNPAMGFVNITQADFHLHLRAKAIAGWRSSDDAGVAVQEALDSEGAPIGLVVRGVALAQAQA
jgi:putative heme degradation protein